MTNESHKPSRYIAGIHNYCDRWCERCAFTSRCRAYAIEQTEFGDPETRDLNNQAFWDKLHGIFRSALGQLRDKADPLGIEVDDVTDEDMQGNDQIQNDPEQHPCVQAAQDYMNHARQWFQTHEALLAEKGQQLTETAGLDLPDHAIEEEYMEIKDLIEVIQWYHCFIPVKIRRALSGLNLIDLDENLHDAHGSAKVALIAMDRSIAAWTRLCDHLPDQEDSIIDPLLKLDRLRKQLEHMLPNARVFIRPGLDE